MSWTYSEGGSTITLQDGWFVDTFRTFDKDTTYYLFSADNSTTFAPGTNGVTIASNLPELFNSTGWTYDSLARPSGKGDTLTLNISSSFSRLDGLPDHPVTGKKALSQTLSSEVEGIYWEGSRLDDQLIISINESLPSLKAVRYLGLEGNDTVYIKGDFDSLVSQSPIPNFGGSTFWGGDGDDSIVLEGSSNNWVIRKLTEEVGFEISSPSSGNSFFLAREVESIVTDDKIINYDGSDASPRSKNPDLPQSPSLLGAVVDGNEIILEFDDLINPGSVKRSRFQIRVNGKRVKTSNASIEEDSTIAVLTSNRTFTEDDKVLVSYVDPRGDQQFGVLEDQFGNDIGSFKNVKADIF